MFVWICARLMGYSPFYALPFCVIVGGLLNLMTFKLVYSGLKVREELKVLALLAVGIVFRALNQILGYVIRELPRFRTIDFGFIVGEFDVQIMGIPASLLVSTFTLSSILLAKWRYPQNWRYIKAIHSNPQLAMIQGLNIDRIRLVSWFTSGGLAGLCGGIIGFWVTSSPSTGDSMMPAILAGSFLGGLDDLGFMIIGGGLIGVIRGLIFWVALSFEVPYILEYLGLIPLIVLGLTLWFEPNGLYVWYKKRKVTW